MPSRHGFPCVLPPPEREDFGLGTETPGAFALSAGTAWVALDRYLAGRPLPAHESEGERDALLRTLVRRQMEALAHAGWHQLRDWQALPDRGGPGRAGLAERSRTEFRRLRQSIDDGTPVMLYLVLAQGRHADPSENIAVLAYDYELDRRARRASVRVYDPSRPGNDNVRLVFHAGAARGLDARLAVKTPVRGFFCVPYDRPEPASLALHSAGNDDARIETILAVHGDSADASFEALGLGRDGRVLHVRRRRSGGYATERIDVDVLDGSDIARAAFVGSGRTVLWNSKGELIDCRRRPGLGWRARRITDTRTHGTFDGVATGVSRERGRVSLFACGTGRLMHFHRGRLPTWEAEHIAAGPLARAACTGTPDGVRLGSAMHVVARTRSGELMHAHWHGRGGWTAENITARASDRERFLVVDDPILLADRRGRALCVVGRSKSGAAVLFRWTDRKGWRAQDLSSTRGVASREALRSDSPLAAAVEQDGTVHVVGRTANGGLLHAWSTREGAAGAHVLTHSRPLLGEAARIDGAPAIMAGPADGLHVLAQSDAGLLLFRWGHNADWSVENLTSERERPRVAQAPLVSVGSNIMHAALLDDDGRVHHAALTPRGGTDRRLRAPTWLIDTLLLPLTITGILADAVSALIGLTKGRGTAAVARGRGAMSDGIVARPRSVPVQALPHLRDDEPPVLLPLIEEQGVVRPDHAALEAAPAAPENTAVEETTVPGSVDASAEIDAPVQDDWSWEGATTAANDDMLAGPLDHLLNFGVRDERTAEVESREEVEADARIEPGPEGTSDVHVESPAKIEAAGATQAAPENDAAVEAEVPAAAEAAAVEPTVEENVIEPVAATLEEIVMEQPASSEAAAVAPTVEESATEPAASTVQESPIEPVAATAETATIDRDAGMVERPASESAEPHAEAAPGSDGAPPVEEVTAIESATPGRPASSDELIIVYPEPEKRSGKARRNGASRPTNGKPQRAKGSSRPDDVTQQSSAASRIDRTPAQDNTGAGDDPPESTDPLPLLHDGQPAKEPPVSNEPPAEPWSLPMFEVTRDNDDWNAPADDAPWNVAPVEGLESAHAAPDTDDWNLPPVDGLEPSEPAAEPESDDWSLPPVEGLQQEDTTGEAVDQITQAGTAEEHNQPAADASAEIALQTSADVPGDEVADASSIERSIQEDAQRPIDIVSAEEPRRPSISDTDDDWNLPEGEPAVMPTPVEAAAQASDTIAAVPGLTVEEADAAADPVEAVPRAADTSEPSKRRKWQNPALEGLPLLDDNDDDVTPREQPPIATAKEPPKPPAKPAARKKPKKASAAEMERIIALAEANQPELLPPD